MLQWCATLHLGPLDAVHPPGEVSAEAQTRLLRLQQLSVTSAMGRNVCEAVLCNGATLVYGVDL